MDTHDSSSVKTSPIIHSLLVFALILAALAVLRRYIVPQKDPREPPYLPSTVPGAGHLINGMREGARYYDRLDKLYHQHLYTLAMPTGRLYLVTSPDWAQAVHKATKTLSFNTLVVQAMEKIFCMDEPSMAIIKDKLNGEQGDRSGVLLETHDILKTTLAPGKDLDELNRKVVNAFAPHVNALVRDGKPEKIHLWRWLRDHFSMASVLGIYGPENPFEKSPGLVDDFWKIEANTLAWMMVPFPSIFLRKAYLARQRVFDGFIDYAENERWETATQLIKNHAEVNLRYGLSKKMYGMGEVSMVFAALVNTIPSAFWTISYIFTDPKLLADIRAEIDQCSRLGDGQQRIINATKLKTKCPLFNSAFRETLRIIGLMNINRYILEDTVVTNHSTGESYLLKKDNMVQIAASVIHYEPSVYGEDADKFNPRRFFKTIEKSKGDHADDKPIDAAAAYRDANGKVHSGSFRPFGGGNNVCPGRHFAQTEIQALAALFVAGFEIENADSANGSYTPPPFERFTLLQGVVKPARDVEVNVRRRQGYEQVEWQFEM